jgi:excinuclease ABC subunit B
VPPVDPSQRLRGNGDWLLMIDESHVTLPQLRAMYNGDQSRKKVLVEHGFRLPSALDNRPLRFEEIEKVWPQVLFVSATPGPYELQASGGAVVEQLIRPTGLLDPVIEVRPAAAQVPDLMQLARERAAKGERTLVTTLTKRLAEDLAAYLADQGLRCRYLHSEILTFDRVQILRDLREGQYDVLVGVNLLREGLDLPEVSLVGIMDADKAGFLRSATSLIQQIGRAARNVNATVILYADVVTPAMKQAIDETNRRHARQLAFNAEHGITPQTIRKEIRRGMELEIKAQQIARAAISAEEEEFDLTETVVELERQMLEAAQSLEFEKAAGLRDRIKQLKDLPTISDGGKGAPPPPAASDAPGTPGTRARQPRKSVKRFSP